MENPEKLKLIVRGKYGAIATQGNTVSGSSCCGSTGCCGDSAYTMFSDDYTGLEGYNPEADLGLGCGLPVEYAGIRKGDHILDLGSGAGNDCFVAAGITGENGRVTGLDFTTEMISRAKENLKKTRFSNIEFIQGDIEEMPLADNSFDVVISNCVINLVPDKVKAFREILRVLKPGGHFCISDIVLEGLLPAKIEKAAEMYAGCVSGALQSDSYMGIIESAGFAGIRIEKRKKIEIPDNILLEYLSRDDLENYKKSGTGIFSITVTAEKEN